jgi:hypothetical protein
MSVPPHTTWINLDNLEQRTWLGTQMRKRNIGEGDFHNYKQDQFHRNSKEFDFMKEQMRLIEISWRSKMSRDKTTTITITKQTQNRIQRYCASKKNQITPLELLEEFSKSLKNGTYVNLAKEFSENRQIKKTVSLAVEGLYENLRTLQKVIEDISHHSHIAHTALKEADNLDLLEDRSVLSKAKETLPKDLKEGLDAISRLKGHITRMEKDTLTIGAELQGMRRRNSSII